MASTTGTIKRKTDKGFGFIAAADGREYFFHQSGCVGTRFDDLREGQRVSFTVGQGPKVRERRTSSRNSVEWPPAAAP
jgi:cold shock protein